MFTITKRQYDLIMHQAEACYPQESGGILGGREDVILGVLPVFNQYLYDRTGSFGITADDIDRGYRFLEKNKLDYYGIYHSHPKGVPYPSKQDLSHGQKYHFIIGLANRYDPEFYAWQVEKGGITQVPIRIVDESFVEQMYLTPENPRLTETAMPDEMKELSKMIDNIIHGRDNTYVKVPEKWDSTTFSTKA
jgi:[CysO sulfur-carrier protein]-S-L-cysteine hydrolase